jgi:hypothetical protein
MEVGKVAQDKTIVRVSKNKENPYVMLNKEFLINEKISWKSKGLLSYLLSKPDNWKVMTADLINRSKDSEKSVRAGIKELEENGYIERKRVYKNGRIDHWEIVIYETPITQSNNLLAENGKVGETQLCSLLAEKLQVEKLQVEKLHVEKLHVEKEGLLINELSNNDLNNNQSINQDKKERKDDGLIDELNKKFEVKELSKESEIYKDIVFIIHDVLTTNLQIKVNGELKPNSIVKSVFNKLKTEHLQHVVQAINEYEEPIKNTRNFIISSLYNSVSTINSFYKNKANNTG